jgi:hypothetical protein
MVAFPFAPAAHQFHTFRDAKGFTARIGYYMAANGSDFDSLAALANSILTQVKLLTNAAYQGSSGPLQEYGVKQYGTAAAYGSVRMKARLAFQDLSGNLHNLHIPAAKLAVFDTDEQTVKPSAVAALVALMTFSTAPASGTPFVCTAQAALITNYMGGFFVARQTRLNKLFYLNAALTPSEPGD